MPRAIILLPGVGAQGGTPADVARAFTSGPASALVNASRSVIYAYRDAPDDDWRAAAGHEAARLSSTIWAAAGW
jgi:orotidine-5'-phosphate decarboxylase